jgi:hypothetical protein
MYSEFLLKETANKQDSSAADCPTARPPVSLETKEFKMAYSAYLLPPQCRR